MNNSYLFKKEPMTKHNINVGSTILGRFGSFILVGLTILSLAGCGGGGGSGSGSRSPNMQITPPSSGTGADWYILETKVSDSNVLFADSIVTTSGRGFTLSVSVARSGSETSPSSRLVYKRARSLPITSSDTTVGTQSVTIVDPFFAGPEAINLTAPATPGTYYYGACVDSVSGESNTSNNCSGNQGVRVTVSDGTTPPSSGDAPDLIIQSNFINDILLTPGQQFTLSVTVRNQGNSRAPATTLRYKRDPRIPIISTDTTVGTDSVPSLDPSSISSESISLTAPSTPGTYYYGACVDSVSGESNTSNNCSGNQGVRVTVRAQSTSVFGAFAFTWNAARTYAWGSGSGSTRSVAESNARARCRLHGGQDCTIILWFSNQCGALAVGTDENGRTDTVRAATGATISAAESNAIQSCRAFGGRSCRIDSTDDAQTASFCARN